MADGPAGFRRGFTCPAVLRIRLGGYRLSSTGLLPSLAGLSRPVHLRYTFVTPCETSYNPREQAPWFGLIRVRSPLLTESLLLPFPVGTEMFQFPTFAFYVYAFNVKYPCGWVAPFGDPRIAAWLPAPRGLSQVPTSFIASERQDIHRAPLLA